MRVGVPTEIKDNEFRVAITPAGVHALTRRGHTVTVQSGAGVGAAIPDDDYIAAGAAITDDVPALWADSEMVLKVKEPIAEEYSFLRPDLLLFTYLHLAADRPLTEELIAKRVTSIAYETVATASGALPLLAPMSEIAGRLAAQVGADALLRPHGGAGVLLGGAAGVRRGDVVVLGGGTAGLAAARVAAGMGANVTVFDIDPERMRRIEEVHGGAIRTRFSTELDVARACAEADLVIGAAPGHAPDGRGHAAGQCAGGHRHRPGRMLRGLPPHHPLRAHLRGGRQGLLLRGQYARRRAAHLHLCADQRDASLRPGPGRRRLARRLPGERGAGPGSEHS